MIFTILGTHQKISLAEIESVTKTSPISVNNRIAFFESLPTELTTLQKRLGGTVKLGHIVGSFHHFNVEELANFMSTVLLGDFSEGKRVFAVSYYNLGDSERFRQAEQMERILGNAVKKEVKKEGFNARFIESKSGIVNAATLKRNKVLEKGAEFVLFFTEKEVLIGQTASYQDIDDWSMRDFHRPARDAQRGMLPPKLARMMVNIAGADTSNKTLIDPFCGSGTVLMEAGLVGYEKLIGSDIAERATYDTDKNLKWTAVKNDFPPYELHTTTAANLPAVLKANSVDVAVMEPFLGKPRSGMESIHDVRDSVYELGELFKKTFSGIYKIMKNDGVLVLVSPVHIVDGQEVPVRTEQILTDIGFVRDTSIDTDLRYGRDGQFVERDLQKYIVRK